MPLYLCFLPYVARHAAQRHKRSRCKELKRVTKLQRGVRFTAGNMSSCLDSGQGREPFTSHVSSPY